MKHHSMVKISMFFKKTKFTLLKSIYFQFKAPTKQMPGFLYQVVSSTRVPT